MAVAGSLVVTISAKTADFEAGMRKVRIEVQTTQKAVTQAESSFSNLGTSLLGLTAGVASVTALSAAMGEVVRVGTEMANLRASFVAISGGAQAGNREFGFVVQTANKLGLELKSVAEQYRSLSAATRGTALEGAATRELFTALSNAAQTFGLSTEQLGRALTAVQQIASKGKVSMEELRGQLGEALPGAMQIAARAFNTTTKGLEDMIAKGVDATEFVTRFTAQLKVETPAAAERAGKGIAQLGNEILLLKDRIAQSGLLKFLDDVAAKLANIAKQSRTASEEAQAAATRTATRALGGEDPSKIPSANIVNLQNVSRRLNEAEDWLRDVRQRMPSGASQITMAQKEVDALKRQQTELAAVIKQEEARRRSTLENSKLLTEMDDQYSAQRRQEERDKAAEPGRIADRFKEIQGRTEAQIKDQEAAYERAKKLTQDKVKREKDAERLREAKERADEAAAAKEVARLRELGAADDRAFEQLKRLEAQYTSVRAVRDDDTASMLAASLQTSQYAEASRKLAERIEAVMQAEAKLPGLRAEAAASAEQLTKDQATMARLQQEFEPRRRGESTQERLTSAYAEMAQQPFVTMGTLAENAKKMQEALDTELWDKWRDVGLDALDHVGDAFADLALKGKLSFKDMLGSIADDLFRFSMQQLMQSATKQGGWLEVGLDFGLKALGIAAGGFGKMPGSGTLPTTEAAYTAQAAAGRFSGRQHGGPVMSDKFYMVGERGPELFRPGTSGTIIPTGQVGGTVVNVHVSGVRDVQSFVQSRGAVSRAMMSAFNQARGQM